LRRPHVPSGRRFAATLPPPEAAWGHAAPTRSCPGPAFRPAPSLRRRNRSPVVSFRLTAPLRSRKGFHLVAHRLPPSASFRFWCHSVSATSCFRRPQAPRACCRRRPAARRVSFRASCWLGDAMCRVFPGTSLAIWLAFVSEPLDGRRQTARLAPGYLRPLFGLSSPSLPCRQRLVPYPPASWKIHGSTRLQAPCRQSYPHTLRHDAYSLGSTR
jgi:hypothetical protein